MTVRMNEGINQGMNEGSNEKTWNDETTARRNGGMNEEGKEGNKK